jgi:hypothetical protein
MYVIETMKVFHIVYRTSWSYDNKENKWVSVVGY